MATRLTPPSRASAPRLLLILDRHVAGDDATWLDHLARIAEVAPRDGSVWVQLRAKRLPAEHRRDLLGRARALTSEHPELPILVNGTSGQALAAGFTGVHWPEALRPAEAPVTAARLTHICAAVHDLAGAQGALRAGARVVTWSPVYDPGSKPGTGRGLDELRRFVQHSPLPVLALGGITADNVAPCLEAGAAGVAVLSAVSRPGADVGKVVERLVDATCHPGPVSSPVSR